MIFAKFKKTDERAVIPQRAHSDDVGWDLSVISLVENKKHEELGLYMYDTGLQIEPHSGYYVEVHGRSSLPLKGYQLANNVGIIDPKYRGNLFILLKKIHPSVPDIDLSAPFKCCQLIFRPIPPSVVEWYSMEELSTTERGAGGFGSTE